MPESIETYRELTAACRAADNRRAIIRGVNKLVQPKESELVCRNDAVLELFLLEKKIKHLVWWTYFE